MIQPGKEKKFFYLLCLYHLIIWTVIPYFSNRNLPLDVIEALAWGQDFDLGYSKHPPLSAWIPGLFFKIFGNKFEYPVSWGTDLQSEHERYLTEQLVGRPVILMNYPKDIKAFYMRMNDDGKTVAAMDILAPGIGEIVGGSQREERLDMLDKRIDEMKLDRNAYWWYRDLRRYGTVPHAGFGLGFERAIVYATGMANIRDVIPFARTPKSCEF